MGFTQDKRSTYATGDESKAAELSVEQRTKSTKGLPEVDESSPIYGMFEPGDCQIIIRYFEVESGTWEREDYAHIVHYRDIYSTENFSKRVREQLSYYPGMHSASPGGVNTSTGKDPFETNAQKLGDQNLSYWNEAMDSPESFMTGLQGAQNELDYSTIIQGEDGDDRNVSQRIASAVAECIPCFDRIFSNAQLLPSGDLLDIHALNIKMKFDLLDKLSSLFDSPGFNIDICTLLEYFTHLCPSDILAMSALLSQYLAKLNLDFTVNLDLIIELIGPLLSPFLDSVAQWLDKWVQMILGPLTCVVDHINMTLHLAQSFEKPLSKSNVNLGYDAGAAGPSGFGAASEGSSSFGFAQTHNEETGLPVKEEEGSINPYFKAETTNEAFRTPDSQRYSPKQPTVPKEEVQMALAQARADFSEDKEYKNTNKYDSLSSEERQTAWQDIKTRYWTEENTRRDAPLQDANPQDGSRWSNDDRPVSEDDLYLKQHASYNSSAQSPEKQAQNGDGMSYYVDPGALVSPIIQMRNIVMAGIDYVNDWFKWATQLVYDLIGTDFGWMQKKTDNTILKSRIIQLLAMLKSILQAVEKNGLKCGLTTNYNFDQMKYILENGMNGRTPYVYEAQKDGSFKITLPTSAEGSAGGQNIASGINQTADSNNVDNSEKSDKNEQNSALSGIIIKDCFNKVKESELSKVREWISDLERRSNA